MYLHIIKLEDLLREAGDLVEGEEEGVTTATSPPHGSLASPEDKLRSPGGKVSGSPGAAAGGAMEETGTGLTKPEFSLAICSLLEHER